MGDWDWSRLEMARQRGGEREPGTRCGGCNELGMRRGGMMSGCDVIGIAGLAVVGVVVFDAIPTSILSVRFFQPRGQFSR